MGDDARCLNNLPRNLDLKHKSLSHPFLGRLHHIRQASCYPRGMLRDGMFHDEEKTASHSPRYRAKWCTVEYQVHSCDLIIYVCAFTLD